MRILIWLAAITFTLTACGGGSGGSNKEDNPIDINDNLIGYFPFSGNANDESGNGNHATDIIGATLTADRSNNDNSAYFFDGVDNEIVVPININPDVLPEVTITTWVRSDDGEGVVISNDRQDSAGFDRTLGIDFRGGGIGWSAFAGTGQVVGFIPVAVGEWTFLAVVYDQTNGTVKVYVNDQSFEGTGTLSNGFDTTTIGTNPGFKVSFPQNYFEGAIDEVRIYNRALTENEVMDVYLFE